MGFSELFDSFNADKYHDRLLALPNAKEAICKEEIKQLREQWGSGFKVVAEGGLVWCTGGMSLIGCALGARQGDLADQKLDVIHQIMKEKGWKPHKETKRDVLIPLASTVVGLGVGHGVDVGMGHIADVGTQMAIAHGAHEAAHYTTSQTISAAATNHLGFLNGVEHGARIATDQVLSVLHPGDLATNAAHATVAHAIPLGSSASAAAGMNLGHTGMSKVIEQGAKIIAGATVDKSGDAILRNRKGTLLDSAQPRGGNSYKKISEQPKYLPSYPRNGSKSWSWQTVNSTPNKAVVQDYRMEYPANASMPRFQEALHATSKKALVQTSISGSSLLWAISFFWIGFAGVALAIAVWGFVNGKYDIESGEAFQYVSSVTGSLSLASYNAVSTVVLWMFVFLWVIFQSVIWVLDKICGVIMDGILRSVWCIGSFSNLAFCLA